jgi:hypothetical protein
VLIDTTEDTDVPVQVLDGSDSPVAPDAAPTFHVFDGAAGEVAAGTATKVKTGTVTGVTNASPAVVTSANHGLSDGTVVKISGVVGATGVNGTRPITRVDANTFSVAVAAGGAYVSGGAWEIAGLYKIPFDSSIRTLLEPGRAYTVIVYYAVSAVQKADTVRFNAT